MKPLVYVAGPYSHPDPVMNVREAVLCADRMESMKKLGETITYEDPKGKKHEGKLLGVWPGVQFYVLLRNGHRLWTITFPDTDREWVA